MYRLVYILIAASLMLVGCAAQTTEEALPEPIDLLKQAAANIRAAETMRMKVERSGAPYFLTTDLGSAEFRRADVQYVAPDIMQARVRVAAAGIPIDLDFFFEGEAQWLRGIWTNNTWMTIAFVPGFNPRLLIAEQTGFQAAIDSLRDTQMTGRVDLIDGTPAYHIRATADGAAVSAFMAGLITVTGSVEADLYVHRETFLPVQFVIVQPDTATDEQPDPTTWTIDLFDFNAPAQLDRPEN